MDAAGETLSVSFPRTSSPLEASCSTGLVCSGEIQDAHRSQGSLTRRGCNFLQQVQVSCVLFEYCCFFLHVKAADFVVALYFFLRVKCVCGLLITF